MSIPGSPEQLFEQRISQLCREADEIIKEADAHPHVIALQAVDTQLLLSQFKEWFRNRAMR